MEFHPLPPNVVKVASRSTHAPAGRSKSRSAIKERAPQLPAGPREETNHETVRLMPHRGQIEAPPNPCRSSPTGLRVICGAASQSMQSTRHILTAVVNMQQPRTCAGIRRTAQGRACELDHSPGLETSKV